MPKCKYCKEPISYLRTFNAYEWWVYSGMSHECHKSNTFATPPSFFVFYPREEVRYCKGKPK